MSRTKRECVLLSAVLLLSACCVWLYFVPDRNEEPLNRAELGSFLDAEFEFYFRKSYEGVEDIIAQISLSDAIIAGQVELVARERLESSNGTITDPFGGLYAGSPVSVQRIRLKVQNVIAGESLVRGDEIEVIGLDGFQVSPGDNCVFILFDQQASPLLGSVCTEPRLYNQYWNYQLLLESLISQFN